MRPDERAGVHPRVGRVLVSGRRLAEVERHAELAHLADQRRGVLATAMTAPVALIELTTNSSGVLVFAP